MVPSFVKMPYEYISNFSITPENPRELFHVHRKAKIWRLHYFETHLYSDQKIPMNHQPFKKTTSNHSGEFNFASFNCHGLMGSTILSIKWSFFIGLGLVSSFHVLSPFLWALNLHVKLLPTACGSKCLQPPPHKWMILMFKEQKSPQFLCPKTGTGFCCW